MVSFTTSVSWPPAAVTTVLRFSHTWRNWATMSPLPTVWPSLSLATWPAKNRIRPPCATTPWAEPTPPLSVGGGGGPSLGGGGGGGGEGGERRGWGGGGGGAPPPGRPAPPPPARSAPPRDREHDFTDAP